MVKKSIAGIVCAFLVAFLLWGALWIALRHTDKTAEAAGTEDVASSVRETATQEQNPETEQEETTEYETEAPAVIEETLQQDIETILSDAGADAFSGYAVDEAFLLWLWKNYGEAALDDLAGLAAEKELTAEQWYALTGSSIHVLWTDYCRDTGYAAYRLENVKWVDCSDADSVTMDFIGDINFDEEWDTMRVLDERGGMLEQCISADILKELSSADITMANNEFTFSTRGTAQEGKSYVFRADPLRVKYYGKMGVDIVSLANNHTWDYGEDALFDTLETLKQEQIAYTGAGMNIEEATAIPYFVANGRKIAIVSATQIERYHKYTKEADETSAGVLKTLNPKTFVRTIREAKKTSDYVIVYVHWGTEGNLYPDEDEAKLAEKFVDAGADAVIGGHSHRLQGATFIKGCPVLYSLGNFWFSDGDLYTTIARLTIQEDGTLRVSLVPCEQKNLAVDMLTGQSEINAFYEYIADLSSGVGITSDGTLYDIGEAGGVENLPALSYQSGLHYRTRHGDVDLQGKSIDIVGNVK